MLVVWYASWQRLAVDGGWPGGRTSLEEGTIRWKVGPGVKGRSDVPGVRLWKQMQDWVYDGGLDMME